MPLGKSGLHAHCEGERVIALESWKVYWASRTVKEGLSRCFLGHGSKPWVPSTYARDLRELLRVPLRSQGYCAVGRGRSELHWVWCSRRGPYLELRQEPHGFSPFLNRISVSMQSWDKSPILEDCSVQFHSIKKPITDMSPHTQKEHTCTENCP